MTQLKIAGMTCDSCAVHVKEALEKVPGVHSAVVSYPQGTAQLAFEPGTPLDALTAAVAGLGYRATLFDAPPADKSASGLISPALASLPMVSIASRRAETGGAQAGFIDPAPGAAASKLSVDRHRRHRAHAQRLRSLGDRDVAHVEHIDFARRAGQTLHQGYYISAGRAAGAEHFDFTFGSHVQAPFNRGEPGYANANRPVTMTG